MEAAFFDLDKTIISRSSSLALSRPLYRAGMVSRGQLLRGAYAQLVYLSVGADENKMERLKEGMLALTKGWDRTQIEHLVQDVLLDVIDPYVYQEALDLMDLHRSEGRRIYIVSSSPEEIVRPLARHFGVSGVIATRAEVGDDGRYTGDLEFYAYGEQKAEAIDAIASRMGIDLSHSYAYSDSITDLPMLEIVGEPVAVNPDKDLRKIEEERDWQTGTSAGRCGCVRGSRRRCPRPSRRSSPRWAASPWRRSWCGSSSGRGTRAAAGAPDDPPRAPSPTDALRIPDTGCSVESASSEASREQNRRASHAAGGMLRTRARCHPAPEHVRHALDTCSPRLWPSVWHPDRPA